VTKTKQPSLAAGCRAANAARMLSSVAAPRPVAVALRIAMFWGGTANAVSLSAMLSTALSKAGS